MRRETEREKERFLASDMQRTVEGVHCPSKQLHVEAFALAARDFVCQLTTTCTDCSISAAFINAKLLKLSRLAIASGACKRLCLHRCTSGLLTLELV